LNEINGLQATAATAARTAARTAASRNINNLRGTAANHRNRRIHQKVSLTFSSSRFLLAHLVTIHSLPGAPGCAIALDALIVCDQVLGNMTIDAGLSGEIPGQAERGRSGTCD
jgi:hypothetical protein